MILFHRFLPMETNRTAIRQAEIKANRILKLKDPVEFIAAL